MTQRPQCALEAKLWDVDSEGEQVTLCAHCLLPVGEARGSCRDATRLIADLERGPQVSYSGQQGKSTPLHGECAAQLMLQEMKEKDVKRVQDSRSAEVCRPGLFFK